MMFDFLTYGDIFHLIYIVNMSDFFMENLRYLLTAIAALTLIMSVVSGVNPNYFAGLNAFADHNEEEDDDDNSGSNDDHDDDRGKSGKDSEHEEHEGELVQSLGNNSKVTLEIDDDAVEIKVELEGLNMTDGSYDAVFACEQPALNVTLDNAFEVEDGKGELGETIGLANGTYSGCDITVGGTVLASFDTFTVSEETEEEQENEVEEKRKERKERIVTTTSGREIHEKHRGENAASPGEFQPGWNYMLMANGTAMTNSSNEADATVDINMTVWKSTGAVILLDVIDGTVEVGNQTYTVVLGYAVYTIHHDTLRVGALAVDDDGNVFKLKLRGSADDDAEFPMESGSLYLTFEGSSGPSNNRFGDWKLTLEGTVEAD
jgi:hypothetical protein